MKKILEYYLLVEVVIYILIVFIVGLDTNFSYYFTIIYLVFFFFLNIIFNVYRYLKYNVTPKVYFLSIFPLIAYYLGTIPFGIGLFGRLHIIGNVYDFPKEYSKFIENANDTSKMSKGLVRWSWVYYIVFQIILLFILFMICIEEDSPLFGYCLLIVLFLLVFRLYIVIKLGVKNKRLNN